MAVLNSRDFGSMTISFSVSNPYSPLKRTVRKVSKIANHFSPGSDDNPAMTIS